MSDFSPNPLLRALGLADTDRVVLIHTDDIGMCHASLAAYADLATGGVISAASTMTPCPWFPATAQFCREHPDIVDMGVHITLNSEWNSGYAWGAISTRDPASGLLDERGAMHSTTAATQVHATPAAVRAEITAQVERALAAGIDVTHIDSHMGTAFFPGYLESYIEVALQHRIPPFLVRQIPPGFDPAVAGELLGHIRALEARGLPMFDKVTFVPFDHPDNHLERTKASLSALAPGLTYLIIHPSADTPELRAILPDGWQVRVAEYQTFMREELRDHLRAEGIHLVGWRALRELLRAKF